MLEQINGFIARAADATWALDIAIYEYELPAIIDSVKAALDRGADVRIVFHAAPGDTQTAENEKNLAGWPADRMRPRVTSNIFHDKFAVLSRVRADKRDPVSVLCGSTNWTRSGVYLQANVVHIAESAELAGRYLTLFEVLFGGATVPETKKWIDDNDPLPDDPIVAGFSPRSGEKDLDAFVATIDQAKSDVLFCTAFDLNDRIEKALLGEPHDDVLRIGLQNKPSEITGYHRDRTADFVATAYLKEGLDGYLAEKTRQPSGILIHTKLVVVNFTSDDPVVISGSHNLSAAASGSNDENFLVVRGDTDVADCYGVEAMRLYDHYRYRWVFDSKNTEQRADDPVRGGRRTRSARTAAGRRTTSSPERSRPPTGSASVSPSPEEATSMAEPNDRFRILSVDGGGMRGLIPARVIENLEQRLQAQAGPDARVVDYFHMFAGTSTGGLVALSLTVPEQPGGDRPKVSASELAELYTRDGKGIFHRSLWQKLITLWGLRRPKYTLGPLEEAVKRNLGADAKLADALRELVVVAYDMTDREP